MKTIAMAGLLLGAAPGPTAEVPLAPVGKWAIDYGDATCTLAHEFGDGPSRVTVALDGQPLGNADTVRLVAISAGKAPRFQRARGKVTLQPSGQVIDGDVEIYGLAEKGQVVVKLNAGIDTATAFKADGILTIEAAGARRTIVLPGVTSALQAMRACQADLVKSWGVDSKEVDAIKTRAEALSPENWVTGDDYPSQYLGSGVSGTTHFVFTIGTNGRVTDCKVVLSSGTAALDQAACHAVTLRGRFKPAHGRDDQPMISHWLRKVVWTPSS